jgi:tetratricopeptide (TPR) repeat protein
LKIKLNDVYCLNKLTAIAEYRIKENEEKQRQNFEKIKAIADIHFAKNEFNDAEVSYKNALEILPNDKYCKNRLAKIKEIRDQVQKKKEEYENAIKQASDFFARGDWENAEIFYKKTLNIKPEDPICFAQIEKIAQLREEERNRNEEFEKHVIQASGFVEVRNWDQAAVCCNEALKIKPNDDYCKIKLAEILDARKRDEEEQEQFEKAFRQASDYFKEGDWENAEIFYKKALIIKPKDPICESHITKIAIQHIEDERKRNGEFEKHVKQASGYLEVRNWDQATACYNEALKIKPNDDYCKTKLAEILDALKRDEVEQEQFEKAFRQASACFKQGDLDNAEIFYKKALGLKPEDPICESRLKEIADLREKDAEFERYVKQASEFYDKRNWNQAEDSYKEALKIKPTDKTCLNRLAAITDYRNKENEERKRQKKLETSPKGSVKTFSIDKNRFFGKRTLIIVGSIFMLLCLILIGFLLFNNPDEKKIVKEPVKDSTYKQKPDTIIIKKPVENSKPESSNKNDAIKDRMEKKQKASFIINDTTLKFSNGYFRGSYNKKDTNMVKGYYYFTKGGGLIYKNDPMKRTVKVGDSLVGKWSKEGFYRGTLYSKDGDSIRINAGQK